MFPGGKVSTVFGRGVYCMSKSTGTNVSVTGDSDGLVSTNEAL